MQVVVFIILFLGTIGIFCLKPFQKTGHGTLIVAGWFVKMTFAFAFVHIFTSYYGNGTTIRGDAYNFMNDSRLLAAYGKESPSTYFKLLIGIEDDIDFTAEKTLVNTQIWSTGDNGDLINDNRLMIRLNSIVHFFSFGYVYTHALIMAFLSYLGLLLLFKALKTFVKNEQFFLALLIFYPSFSFWGSGITKEALLFFSLGLFIYSLFKLFNRFSVGYLVTLLLAISFLLINKPHVGLVLISLATFLVLGKALKWNVKLHWIIPSFTLLATILLTYLPSQINLLDKVSYKQHDLINIGKGGIFFVTDSSFCAFDYAQLNHFDISADKKQLRVNQKVTGTYKLNGHYKFNSFDLLPSDKQYGIYLLQAPSNSYVSVPVINYERKNLITSLPTVFANTLLRPFPWDPGSNLKYVCFGTNILFFILFIFTIFNRRKLTLQEHAVRSYLLVAALCILVLIGWTTPILGAIVRYKVAAELLLISVFSISLKPLKK